MLVPDGGSAGGTPPAQEQTTPPAETAPPPEEGIGEEYKGWWAAQLTKETRDKHKDSLLSLKGKQLGEVFDDYFSTQAKLKNAVVFPGKDASPEELDAFLKRMDIPKTADEYEIKAKQIPGPDADEAKATAAKGLADFFKSIGLTKSQGQKMFEQYVGIVKGVSEAGANRQKALADTFDERLLKDLGTEKTVTETKEYFKRALVALGDAQLVTELNQSGMLYSTAFVRGLADIWKASNTEPPMPQAGPGSESPQKDALPMGDQFNKQYGNRRK